LTTFKTGFKNFIAGMFFHTALSYIEVFVFDKY